MVPEPWAIMLPKHCYDHYHDYVTTTTSFFPKKQEAELAVAYIQLVKIPLVAYLNVTGARVSGSITVIIDLYQV